MCIPIPNSSKIPKIFSGRFQGIRDTRLLDTSSLLSPKPSTTIMESRRRYTALRMDSFSPASWRTSTTDHPHFIIRPDDVWLAILTQLNMYIKANSEELRTKFVAHKGKRFLGILISGETGNAKRPLRFDSFVQDMTHKMQEYIVDPNLREWVMPEYSMTTENDRVVASVVFMGAMKNYFSYGGRTGCGLPSVTLIGEKEDWELILSELEKIASLGEKATEWHNQLVPICQRFTETFQQPDSNLVKDFCNYGHGPSERNESKLRIDDVTYHRLRTKDITQGWVDIDIQINDTYHGHGVYYVKMYAGSVGINFESSGNLGTTLDTVKPLT
ncbi:uncharacterized protein PAC_04786 [Phialocephala subalpina]|uniref:Uncharacterized protein n=1 Tax=Phialocephala subalpina TaxID=576137 RepID=A0A1L7WQ70_9HELO|nr:uncharacterized protein PAC_04786 [Phialocephala subalpina]